MLFTRLEGRARVVHMHRGTQEEQMDGCGKGGSQQASAVAGLLSLPIRALSHDLPLKVSAPNILTQGT